MMPYEYINMMNSAKSYDDIYKIYKLAKDDITLSMLDFYDVQCAAFARQNEIDKRRYRNDF